MTKARSAALTKSRMRKRGTAAARRTNRAKSVRAERDGGLPAGTKVEVKAAKGRPMLVWIGKRPLKHVTAFPAQHIEVFDPTVDASRRTSDLWKDWPDVYPRGGLLFHGDNKEVLAHLLANGFRGKVNLIYIDPPFDSGADYVRKVALRGVSGTAKLEGEGYTLGEQIQYTDIWINDNYLQFMYERLLLLKELLVADGLLFLHLDSNRVHYLRVVLDEIFGESNYVNEVIWQQTSAHNDPGRFGRVHNSLLLYRKSDAAEINTKFGRRSQSYVENWFKYALGPNSKIITLKKGEAPPAGYRRFRLSDLRSPHPRPNLMFEFKGYKPHPNGWAVTHEKMEAYDRKNRLHYPSTLEGRILLRNFLDDMDAAALQDMWWDLVAEGTDEEVLRAEVLTDTWRGVRTLQGNAAEATGFPTQKPEGLLARIIETCSDPGDIVLDSFIGSGTAAAVAQKLGRRWIGCDINKGAVQESSKRLQTILLKQIERAKTNNHRQELLVEREENTPPEAAQMAFAVYRVNDYDLQIQHNEAVELACQHIGVTRTYTDVYFDGTLGRKLVKITPFNHPLSPLDLEELKRELAARASEERDVVVVCLGKELAADNWLQDWNRHRREGHVPNRIEVIELRTDPKYGKFFEHKPATAKVDIRRKGDEIIAVDIKNFISPTIIERLQQESGVVTPKIDDWRAMVDCVMIDSAYDGRVFNVVLSDVPARKQDLIEGTYEIPASSHQTTVAVKIIDMLGEEVLVTKLVGDS